jgi:hypothetical protein
MDKTIDTSKMIFVFGSNRLGIHGVGAVRFAVVHKGVEYGIGEGLIGSCYVIPTKGFNISQINLDEVDAHVQKFISYARENPHQIFQVTQIGCGLGGFTKEEIAPMFEFAPENCYFDTMWKSLLPTSSKFWGTF